MNICIPIEDDNGLDSAICAHFGSAPAFMIVNTSDNSFKVIRNNNEHHAHGMCSPLAALNGEAVDGMVVGGIGMGALNKLQAAGIQVFVAAHETVRETVSAYNAGALDSMQPGMTCRGHAH